MNFRKKKLKKRNFVIDEEKIKKNFRIMIIIFIVICAFIIVFSQNMLFSISDMHDKSACEKLKERTEQYSQTFKYKIDSDIQLLEAMAGMLHDSDIKSTENLITGLRDVNKASDFVKLGYFEEDNSVFRITSKNESVIEEDWDNISFQMKEIVNAAWKGESLCSKVYFDKTLGYNVLAYAVPVYINKNVTGVLAAVVSTDVYAEIFSSLETESKDVVGAVLRADGNLLVATIPYSTEGFYSVYNSNLFPERVHEQLAEALVKDDPSYIQFKSSGKTYYGYVKPLGIYSAKMVVIDSEEGINDAISGVVVLMQKIGILFASISIGFAFIVLWIQRKYSRNLFKTAFYDKLTGAYNKEKFMQLLALIQERYLDITVASLNVRKFKFINELFGAKQSDLLLQDISDIINENLKDHEFYCRDNADTFLICFREKNHNMVRNRIEQIFNEIKKKAGKVHPGYPLYFYCGCADVCECRKVNSQEELMTHVMLAMNRAKKSQNESIVFYDLEAHEEEKLENFIESNMQKALNQGEFKMYLQPKVLLSTGKISGAEALVRWITDGKQTIFPNQFIPLFEKNGFCVSLDYYMVEQACQCIRHWIDCGYSPISISVNQTRLLFYEEGYVEKLCKLTEKYHVSPEFITLEILEGLALENTDRINESIDELHRFGFRISMDDFGTGYSSLNVLGKLKIDELKIDRAFIIQAKEEAGDNHKKIMESIIKMAKRMNITTVAEGIETEENVKILRELQCDYGQGYFYSAPITVEEFEDRYMKDF